MTTQEFEALPVVRKALYLDPKDSRCGVILGPFGVEWTVGFDKGVLSKASRDGGLHVPSLHS